MLGEVYLGNQSKDLEVRLFYLKDNTAVTETMNIPPHLNRLIHSHFIFSSPFLSRLISANLHIWEVMFSSSQSFRQGAKGQRVMTARKQLWPNLGYGSSGSMVMISAWQYPQSWGYIHHCTCSSKTIHPTGARYLMKTLGFKILWQNFINKLFVINQPAALFFSGIILYLL